MAVFTPLDQTDMELALSQYDLGDLVSFTAIEQGIENTNYFVDTQNSDGHVSKWVLTVFENLDWHELPYFCLLTRFLANKGFSVPAPVLTRSDESLIDIKGKPAALVPRLQGTATKQPTVDQCDVVGSWLANMHIALEEFTETRDLVRDVAWMHDSMAALADQLPANDKNVLEGYVKRYELYQPLLKACPQGTVHGDLFKDNVLFRIGQVSGVIDFYHACNASLLYDLAVVANDWCIHMNLGITGSKHKLGSLDSLIDGYKKVRPWTQEEEKAWPFFLELAALRFWVSRLKSKYLPGYQNHSVAGDAIKDPDEMKSILRGLVSPNAPVN